MRGGAWALPLCMNSRGKAPSIWVPLSLRNENIYSKFNRWGAHCSQSQCLLAMWSSKIGKIKSFQVHHFPKNCYQQSMNELPQLLGAAATPEFLMCPVHFPSSEWKECSPPGCKGWPCQHYQVPCTIDGVSTPQYWQPRVHHATLCSSRKPCWSDSTSDRWVRIEPVCSYQGVWSDMRCLV